MKPIIPSLLIAFLCAINLSCKKSWLTPQPLSFLSTENVLVNESGYTSFLYTLRKNLRNSYYGNYNLLTVETIFSELGVVGVASNKYLRNMDIQLTPSDDGNHYLLDNFSWCYNSIRVCNTIISHIGDIQWKDSATKNSILAEAFFHRSYWYFFLVNEFGDVPWIGEELNKPKLDFSTYSRWAILQKLQSDMEFSVLWLPETAVPGAVTKAAGNQLLTKIYLSNSQFQKAVQSASAIIDDGRYQLMAERFGIDANDKGKNVIWDLHRPRNFNDPSNKETILATVDRYEMPADARTAGLKTMRSYEPAWWNNAVLDSRGVHGTTDRRPQLGKWRRGNSYVRPTPYYAYDIWNDSNDLRRRDDNWVFQNQLLYNDPKSVDYGKPINPKYFAKEIDTMQYYYSFPQYITYVPEADTTIQADGGNGDWYIYRLAETYLLRAEAYYWMGDKAEAANDINKVRGRSHCNDLKPEDVNIGAILDERARELFIEEPRKSELTRIAYIMAANNLNGYSLTNFSENNFWYDRVMDKNSFYKSHFFYFLFEYRISPYHVLWPIPSDVINANTLGVINQNLGYPGTDSNQPPLTKIE